MSTIKAEQKALRKAIFLTAPISAFLLLLAAIAFGFLHKTDWMTYIKGLAGVFFALGLFGYSIILLLLLFYKITLKLVTSQRNRIIIFILLCMSAMFIGVMLIAAPFTTDVCTISINCAPPLSLTLFYWTRIGAVFSFFGMVMGIVFYILAHNLLHK